MQWYRHVLSEDDGHVIRRLLRFEDESEKNKWRQTAGRDRKL